MEKAGVRKYAVVYFPSDKTYSEIPVNWIQSDSLCWWPNSTKKAYNLMARNVLPDVDTWNKYDIRIESFCTSLESARKKAENSDYITSCDENELGRGKRTKFLLRKESSDDGTSTDSITPPPSPKNMTKTSNEDNNISSPLDLETMPIMFVEENGSVNNTYSAYAAEHREDLCVDNTLGAVSVSTLIKKIDALTTLCISMNKHVQSLTTTILDKNNTQIGREDIVKLSMVTEKFPMKALEDISEIEKLLDTDFKISFRVIGDTGSMSQTTVHRIIQKVSENLARNLRQYVKFPDRNGMNNNRNLFFEIGGFPGVSGCVDGTHIEIKNPGGENAEVFRNRKGWMSLNIQVIAGPRCEILDIVIRWPGSAHDSRIFNNSAVRLRFEQELLTGLLLGDSAYQETHYLFTPVLNPATRAQNLYNNAHIRTRIVVERTFGIWKSRFRCLATCLQYKLRNVVRIIAATAVLHNIAILRGEQCTGRLC
ncbi:hypothetical protein MML48_9g00000572 [Holotrichia oblita]|uniref:Uncharacterized protein n=1 Tax=Holotrichia oblita TaxID=644536 RepID=A0ACB9SIK6_HOLOL|nr:hypothetical protein MML48_9g00000572 [Holotrichia oblita]